MKYFKDDPSQTDDEFAPEMNEAIAKWLEDDEIGPKGERISMAESLGAFEVADFIRSHA